ncbi:MAG: hypothetical protein II457_01830 [Paludibacteraceae bacterium]|jgi:membrane-associated phospholipid phosphatase|nr:hypothetical protein [Paludibacteraceae bacterium]
MSKVLDILAKSISVFFYPLFIPTYGMILFCRAYALHVRPLPTLWVVVALFGTVSLTCLIPLGAIVIRMARGKVTNLQIDDPRERTMPYAYTCMGFGCWAYLMVAILHAPSFIGLVAVGATIAIGLVSIINRWWKISAHMTAMGGLFGGLMSYCLGVGGFPTWVTLCIWIGVVLAVMYARLYVNAHTPAQVCAGWLLGIVCTFTPYCIVSYGA